MTSDFKPIDSPQGKRDRRSIYCVVLLCLLAYIPVFMGVLLGNWPCGSDALALGMPIVQFVSHSLSHGIVPLWNPYNFCGLSFATYIGQIEFYPFQWLYLLLPLRLAFLLDIFSHSLILAGGLYILARALGMSRTASLVVVAALVLSGSVAGREFSAGYTTWHAARAYLPWELWSLLLYLRGGGRRYLFGFAIALYLQIFSGFPHLVVLSMALCAGLVMARRINDFVHAKTLAPLRPAARAQWLFVAGLAFLVCMASAVTVVPLLQAVRMSNHSGLSYSDAVRISASWHSLLRLVAPGFFGGNGSLQWSMPYAAWEEDAYVGILPLLLALGAPLFARRLESNRQVLPAAVPWLWIILPVTLLLAMGDNTPVYHFLFNHLAALRAVRSPARWMDVWTFAVALLAGFSFDGSIHRARRDTVLAKSLGALQGRALQSALAILSLCLLAVAISVSVSAQAPFWMRTSRLVFANQSESTTVFVANYLHDAAVTGSAVACLLAGVGAAFVWLWQRSLKNSVLEIAPGQMPRLGRRWTETMLVSLIALDLLVNFWQEAIPIPAQWVHDVLVWPKSITDLYRPDHRWATEVFDKAMNGNLPAGIADFNGYDPVNSRLYFQFAGAVEGRQFWRDMYQPTRCSPLLRVAGVTDLLVWQPGPRTLCAGMPGVHTVATQGDWQLRSHPGAWPLAYLSRNVLRQSDQSQLTALEGCANRYWTNSDRPVVTQLGAFSEVSASPLTNAESVVDWHRDINELSATTRTIKPSALLLAESWSPGWQASVNGSPVPLERANFLFRAVQVPAGEAQVHLVYDPETYRFGLFLSLCGLMGLVAIATRYKATNHEA